MDRSTADEATKFRCIVIHRTPYPITSSTSDTHHDCLKPSHGCSSSVISTPFEVLSSLLISTLFFSPLSSQTRIMPPKRTQQPPRRRSRRLAGLDPEWPVLAVRAKVRIDAYRQKKEKYNENLARTMHAFIDFLPEGGCQSVARDIVGCANDGELFAVFKKLYTGLLFPSM